MTIMDMEMVMVAIFVAAILIAKLSKGYTHEFPPGTPPKCEGRSKGYAPGVVR